MNWMKQFALIHLRNRNHKRFMVLVEKAADGSISSGESKEMEMLDEAIDNQNNRIDENTIILNN